MKHPILILALVGAAPLAAFAADPAATDADNSARNDRDRSGDTRTPLDQSNDPADLKITAETRKALVGDDQMSWNAKNCKIITTAGGAVTLRGAVDSPAEKKKVAALAKSAGATSVSNQLEVTHHKNQ